MYKSPLHRYIWFPHYEEGGIGRVLVSLGGLIATAVLGAYSSPTLDAATVGACATIALAALAVIAALVLLLQHSFRDYFGLSSALWPTLVTTLLLLIVSMIVSFLVAHYFGLQSQRIAGTPIIVSSIVLVAAAASSLISSSSGVNFYTLGRKTRTMHQLTTKVSLRNPLSPQEEQRIATNLRSLVDSLRGLLSRLDAFNIQIPSALSNFATEAARIPKLESFSDPDVILYLSGNSRLQTALEAAATAMPRW